MYPMTDNTEKPQLDDGYVRLIPLQYSHRDALLTAAADGKLWELWDTSVPSEATIDAYLEKAMREREDRYGLQATGNRFYLVCSSLATYFR